MGIAADMMQFILAGKKTMEVRLKTAKFLTMRSGDIIGLREDTWQDDAIVSSKSRRVNVRIEETLFFDDFAQLLHAVPYRSILPEASSTEEALVAIRQFYSLAQELEHGVIALRFSLIELT